MPPLRSRLFGIPAFREMTWNVGSDDFAAGALLGIAVHLVILGLTIGTLIYFLFPFECEDDRNRVPPLLYISLTFFYLILFLTLINDAAIFSISLRGNMYDAKRRRCLPRVVEMRFLVSVLEVIGMMATSVGVFSPTVGGGAVKCEDYRQGPLVFAKVIVCVSWVLLVFDIVFRVIAVDPLGCFSLSLLDELEDLGALATDTDEEGFLVPGKLGEAVESKSKKRRNYTQLGHRKMYRRFKYLCCWFGAKGSRSTSLAMSDSAKAFHTMFSDLDLVATDIVAGFILLHKDQKKKKLECKCSVCIEEIDGSCERLSSELRDLTFQHIPECQKSEGYKRLQQRPLDFSNLEERLLFEDLLYYMKYSIGMYGWSLYVYKNIFTGLCTLSTVTCCRCEYRYWNSRAREDFVGDDCCLCGVGTLQLSTKREQRDIVYANFGNDVFQAPFSLTVDHNKRAVVLAVRGTLSMKDALTDMSVTMVKVCIPGLESDDLYMHNGMYRTAQWIKSRVHTVQKGEVLVASIAESREEIAKDVKNEQATRKLLRQTMQQYKDYQLVVTGHSLGAGVASILAVLLRPAYPNLICYAFSPPGCIFSLPVAVYSEEFITSVVLGNDLVPRTSFRSLKYLKMQIELLISKCQKPKSQVLFQPRWTEVLSKVQENPTTSIEDFEESLLPTKNLGLQQIVVAKKFAHRAKVKLQRKRTVHMHVKNIGQGDHIASFPPGRMVHLEACQRAKPLCLGLCYPTRMKATWKSFEDFSTLIVDKGIVEDHLPTEVLGALKLCHRQHINGRYNVSEASGRRWGESTDADPVVTVPPVNTTARFWWDTMSERSEMAAENAYQSQRYPTSLTVEVDLEPPMEDEPISSQPPHRGEGGENETARCPSRSEAGLVTLHTVRNAREDSYHENHTDTSALTTAASGFMQPLMTSSGGWASPSNLTRSPDVVLEMEHISHSSNLAVSQPSE